MKRFGKILMVAALAMVSYSASAELAPQWSKGTMMANAELGVQPFGGAVSVDYVLVDEWWKGHFTVGGEFDFRSENHWGAIGVTPRATYGLNITDQFEVHVAAAMGFGFANYDHDGIEDDDSLLEEVSSIELLEKSTLLLGTEELLSTLNLKLQAVVMFLGILFVVQ